MSARSIRYVDRDGGSGRKACVRGLRRAALVVLVATGLAACGARSTGDSTTSGGGTLDANGNPANGPELGAAQPEPINIELFGNVLDVTTGTTDPVLITATLIDDNRVPRADTPVQWSASDGVLQNVSDVADENGIATAELRLPQDLRNRRIEIAVSSGTFVETMDITAHGTTLEVQGGERSVVIGNELELSVTLMAGNGEPIINRPLSVTTANGNRVSPAEPLTDTNGRATVRIGTELGNDTVTIGALDDATLTRTVELNVSTDQLVFSTPGGESEFGVDRVETVDVLWSSNGEPVVDGALRITTSAGQLLGNSVMRTGRDGRISIPLSSASAGAAQVRVQDAQDGDPSGTFDLEFVATTPALVDVSTNSSRVFVNGQSDVTVLVRDAGGNPVKNREVVFASSDLRGGQLNPSSALTDSDGRARTGFVAGGSATETEAIEIFATVQGATRPQGGGLSDSVRLSVVERQLNVTLGAGSKLESIGLETQYAINMVVQVADGSGVPLPEADVALSIIPTHYAKGQLVLVDKDGRPRYPSSGDQDEWAADHWGFVIGRHNIAEDGSGGDEFTTVCVAEDRNENRILDAADAEDTNGNQMLDPQDPAVLTAVADPERFATLGSNGTLITDANGTGYFRLTYPKGNAEWSRLRITARVKALGTEGQDVIQMSMPVLAADVNDTGLSPPNLYSPYGGVLDCASSE